MTIIDQHRARPTRAGDAKSKTTKSRAKLTVVRETHPFDLERHPAWCIGSRGCGTHLGDEAIIPATARGYVFSDGALEVAYVAIAPAMADSPRVPLVNVYLSHPQPNGRSDVAGPDMPIDAVRDLAKALRDRAATTVTNGRCEAVHTGSIPDLITLTATGRSGGVVTVAMWPHEADLLADQIDRAAAVAAGPTTFHACTKSDDRLPVRAECG